MSIDAYTPMQMYAGVYTSYTSNHRFVQIYSPQYYITPNINESVWYSTAIED